jgi:antitoxin YefM
MNISATALREHLAEHLDRVTNDREILHVTRQGARSVVVIDEEEFEGMQETLHLLRSPANARRLNAAMADIAAGKVVKRADF